ncbi:MAG: glyoxalase superfamily protein [Acidobacteriaceae bacterium]
MSIAFTRVIPVLRIFSIERAREFYLDYLGLIVDWEHRFSDGMPLFMQVSGRGLILRLSEHHGDCSPGTAFHIQTTGVREFQAELAAKNYGFLNPTVEPAPQNALQMTLIDPFGNRLHFRELIGS